jgi:hypothetical protein
MYTYFEAASPNLQFLTNHEDNRAAWTYAYETYQVTSKVGEAQQSPVRAVGHVTRED